MSEYFPVIVILIVIPLFFLVGTYNKFIKYRNMIEEAWSSIDVALKRRANLIPNLINIVKGYSRHEAAMLESLTDKRVDSNDRTLRNEEESEISRSLTGLLALAEAYPDLKANTNFLDLQQALNEVEREILDSRKSFNQRVRQLNTLIEQFPSSIIAKFFGFTRASYFSLELATQREMPDTDF